MVIKIGSPLLLEIEIYIYIDDTRKSIVSVD